MCSLATESTTCSHLLCSLAGSRRRVVEASSEMQHCAGRYRVVVTCRVYLPYSLSGCHLPGYYDAPRVRVQRKLRVRLFPNILTELS